MKVSNTSERLQLLLQERGLKQVDVLKMAEPFCKEFDVSLKKNDLSQYVSGKSKPGQSKLTILSLTLDVSEEWLMGYDAKKKGSEIMTGLGDIIRSRRAELGLTLEEVGNFVGVGKSTVKKWEDGYISNMKCDKVASLSEILQLNPITFIDGVFREKSPPVETAFPLTNHEKELIISYRSHPEMQPAVDTLLMLTQRSDGKHEK